MIYELIPNQQEHHNSKHRKLHQLRFACYCDFVFKTYYISVKLFSYFITHYPLDFFMSSFYDTLYYVLSMILSSFKKNHREAPAERTEVRWVHACYLPLDFFVKLFSYNKVISLHNMYLFYSKFILPFTTFLSGEYFNILT